jgi:hypothetical protein
VNRPGVRGPCRRVGVPELDLQELSIRLKAARLEYSSATRAREKQKTLTLSTTVVLWQESVPSVGHEEERRRSNADGAGLLGAKYGDAAASEAVANTRTANLEKDMADRKCVGVVAGKRQHGMGLSLQLIYRRTRMQCPGWRDSDLQRTSV